MRDKAHEYKALNRETKPFIKNKNLNDEWWSEVIMTKLSNNINYKFEMAYRSYKRAKGKKDKRKKLEELFELLRVNAFVNQFNYDHR